MAENLTADTATTPELNSAARGELIRDTFAKVLRLEAEKKRLKAEHLDPISDDIKELWRTAKAENDMGIGALRAAFKLYQLSMADFDQESDRDKLVDDIREIMDSLEEGQMLNWVDVAA